MRAFFGDFVLDTEQRLLSRGAKPVRLRHKALSLLECLVERRNGAVSKDDIMARLWPATFVTDASLTSLVKELRAALDDRADEPRFIRGVRGYGYAFCADVRTEPIEPAPLPASGTEFRLAWQNREVTLAPGENLLGRTHEAMVWVDHPERLAPPRDHPRRGRPRRDRGLRQPQRHLDPRPADHGRPRASARRRGLAREGPARRLRLLRGRAHGADGRRAADPVARRPAARLEGRARPRANARTAVAEPGTAVRGANRSTGRRSTLR